MKTRSDYIETNEPIKLSTSNGFKSILFNFINVFKSISHKWIAIIVFMLVWELLPTIGVVNPMFIPSPTSIATAMWSLTITGILPLNSIYTLARIFIAVGIALLVAIPLGFLLGGFFKNFEKALNPLLNMFSNVNALTLFHVFIILLGISDISMIGAVAWAAQWPMLIHTVRGVKEVDPDIINVARTAGLGKFQIFWQVQIPAALPTIFTGIRLGILFAFLMLMGVEMMGVSSGNGLGFLIMYFQMETMIPQMWAAIVVMSLLGIIVNFALLRLETYLTSWKGDTMIFQER
jgi:NitT/TauT family transport system permease protein